MSASTCHHNRYVTRGLSIRLSIVRGVIYPSLLMLVSILCVQVIFAQDSLEILDEQESPKNDFEILYVANNSCSFCMDVWIVDNSDSTQRFMLDSATWRN